MSSKIQSALSAKVLLHWTWSLTWFWRKVHAVKRLWKTELQLSVLVSISNKHSYLPCRHAPAGNARKRFSNCRQIFLILKAGEPLYFLLKNHSKNGQLIRSSRHQATLVNMCNRWLLTTVHYVITPYCNLILFHVLFIPIFLGFFLSTEAALNFVVQRH